jgi:hypothetical protein
MTSSDGLRLPKFEFSRRILSMISFHSIRLKIEFLVLSKNDLRIPDSQLFDFPPTRRGLSQKLSQIKILKPQDHAVAGIEALVWGISSRGRPKETERGLNLRSRILLRGPTRTFRYVVKPLFTGLESLVGLLEQATKSFQHFFKSLCPYEMGGVFLP